MLRSVTAAPTARPAFELHVTTAPSDRKVVDGHGHPGDLDLVLHFAVCHTLGYAPFAGVPPSLVLTQVADELAWAADHNPPEYAVLNTCRAWRYAVDGALVSKVDGGRWAETRLSGSERTLVRGCARSAVGRGVAPRSTPTSSAPSRGASGTSYDRGVGATIRLTLPGALAVAVGFEPTVGLHPHTLSRRAP